MNHPGGNTRRRGQPLIALALLLVSWAGARAALWDGAAQSRLDEPALAKTAPTPPRGEVPQAAQPMLSPPAPALAPALDAARTDAALPRIWPAQRAPELPVIVAPPHMPSRLTDPASLPPAAPRPLAGWIAADSQLLWLAGMAGMTSPPSMAMAATPRSAPFVPAIYLPPKAGAVRWSADGWLLLRPGGNGFLQAGPGSTGAVVPGGLYGGSQAGLVLRYRLAPASPLRPTAYVRASSAIERPRGEELAAGFSLRPVPRLPAALMVEGRATRTPSGTIIRPAAALVSELPPARLPLGVRAEAYVQAGYVGGRGATAFVDGQARAEHGLIDAGGFALRAGGGVWGGAQRGASRLDVGPTATLSLRLGPAGARVSADYRFRVTGAAAPGSGPVVTLSAGF